jgi:hypothetical protein
MKERSRSPKVDEAFAAAGHIVVQGFVSPLSAPDG